MKFFRTGGAIAWILLATVGLLLVGTTALVAHTANVRFERDVSRMVFNDNVELLESVRREVGLAGDSLERTLATTSAPIGERPYLVISIADHRVWYKLGDSVLFTTQVATGSGKVMEKDGKHWRFETPRGRLVVQSKEIDPSWIPPDWHFIEQARKRGLGIVQLQRGQVLTGSDGVTIAVEGSDIVRRTPGGGSTPMTASDGREIVVGGNIVIPPFGTNQRKYPGVLGTHRLNLGDGYALHGTNQPESIGRSVSHGCVRLRNEDIAVLHGLVEVGTPVFIY